MAQRQKIHKVNILCKSALDGNWGIDGLGVSLENNSRLVSCIAAGFLQ